MLTHIPQEALHLIKGCYAIPNTEAFARHIAALSQDGPLVVVQCGHEWVLVPEQVLAAHAADIRGLQAEIDHAQGGSI